MDVKDIKVKCPVLLHGKDKPTLMMGYVFDVREKAVCILFKWINKHSSEEKISYFWVPKKSIKSIMSGASIGANFHKLEIQPWFLNSIVCASSTTSSAPADFFKKNSFNKFINEYKLTKGKSTKRLKHIVPTDKGLFEFNRKQGAFIGYFSDLKSAGYEEGIKAGNGHYSASAFWDFYNPKTKKNVRFYQCAVDKDKKGKIECKMFKPVDKKFSEEIRGLEMIVIYE